MKTSIFHVLLITVMTLVFVSGAPAGKLHIGRFELVTNPAEHKFHDFLMELGIDEEARASIEKVKIVVVIKEEGDKYKISYRDAAGQRRHLEEFKLGEEYVAEYFGSRDAKMITNWEGDTLVQVLDFQGTPARFELTFSEHAMHVLFTCKDKTAKRVFKRL